MEKDFILGVVVGDGERLRLRSSRLFRAHSGAGIAARIGGRDE